jgi:hypothetical protein
MDGKWSAQGRYINDDGVNLDLDGTVNAYNLNGYYDGNDTISVRIAMDKQATKFKSNTTAGCYSVNRNDFLGGMNFLNAQGLGIANAPTYQVTISLGGNQTVNA